MLVEQRRALVDYGAAHQRVPPTFADAVGRRLAALPAPARGVLHAAALLGRRFDWSLLPVVTGLGDAGVVDRATAGGARAAGDARRATASGSGTP